MSWPAGKPQTWREGGQRRCRLAPGATGAQGGGKNIGLIKDNHARLKQVLENWLCLHRPQGPARPPDWERTEKKHGRLEVRKVWWVVCDEEMQAHLHDQFG